MLRPVVERVVMALGTADLRAQEDPHRVVDVGQRHPGVAELEADGGVFPEPAVGREHLMHPVVVGLIGADRVLHVPEVGLEDERPLRPLQEPKDVGPVVVEVADVVGAFEQVIDEVGTLALRL